MNYVSIIIFGVLLSGCANIKLVDRAGSQIKLCTNARNMIAKDSDFQEEAEKHCGGNYKLIKAEEEFYTDPKDPKLFGVLEIQKDKRMCHIYQCSK